jgi:glutaconyl-CoA decarboxylase
MKYIVALNDKEYEVEVEKGKANIQKVTTLAPVTAPTPIVAPAPIAAPAAVAPAPAAAASSGNALPCPMPGVVVDVKVKVGQSVKKGEVVLVLEAMKMENDITADKDGVVQQISVAKGAQLDTGAPLMIIG